MTALLLVAELVLVLAALGAVVGHAALLAWRTRHRDPAVLAAVSELMAALDAPSWSGAPLTLRCLRRRERLTVLVGLLTSLSGERQERLRAAAQEVGLVAHARRRGRSRRWWRRLEGARLLTLVGGGDRLMLRLLADPREEVRAQALEWAGDHPRAQTVERLLDHLDDPATLCRFTVKESLLRLEGAAGPAVRSRLVRQTGALPEVLEVATWSVLPSYLEPAVALMRHEDADVRRGAVRLLGALGGERGTEPVTAALRDPVARVRAAAAEAVGRLGHWPAAAALQALLRDPVWDVRKQAGLALLRLGAPGTLVLRRALGDADPFAADMARLVLDAPVAVQAVRRAR